VLCTPQAVSGWVSRRAAEIDSEMWLWDENVHYWRTIGPASNVGRIRLGGAGRGSSVYVVSRSALGDQVLSADAVDPFECSQHDLFTTTLAQHCRER
jgi:hypothetical protein